MVDDAMPITLPNMVEAITETIFFHEQEAKQVAARVPPRGSSSKAKSQGSPFPMPSNWEEE
jgi:hypothetical protein